MICCSKVKDQKFYLRSLTFCGTEKKIKDPFLNDLRSFNICDLHDARAQPLVVVVAHGGKVAGAELGRLLRLLARVDPLGVLQPHGEAQPMVVLVILESIVTLLQ